MITMRDALRLYSQQDLFIRSFVKVRHLLSPLEALEGFVAKEGNILDVGCGHGLFTNYMALKSNRRNIIGIDPSLSKINVARKTEGMVHNVKFIRAEVDAASKYGPFDAVTIVDVLYLLPHAKQKELLRACLGLLKPTGFLVLKTQDTKPQWQFALTYIQEVVMVKVFRLTLGNQSLYFMPEHETRKILEEVGFISIEYHNLPNRIIYPNIAFICVKDAGR